MDKTQMFFGAFLAAGAPLSAALAQDEMMVAQTGPYLAFGVGYDSMPDHDLIITGHGVSSQWKSGWGVLAALGYKWDFGIRTELEYSDRLSKVRDFNNTAPWWGDQWDNSLMVNALYDFDIGYGLTPYIGGGFGGTHISWGDNFRGKAPTIYDGESTKVGWQGIVGISYAVTPQVALALDGRIKGAFGDYSFAGSVAGSSITNFNYWTRSIFLSVRYFFGSSGETSHAETATFVPPPVQPPTPAPARATAPRNYLVFFDFDKSDLTPEAVRIVDQAAAAAGPAGVTRIDVTGHTDTVGSDEYNLRLSRRRALSVAAELENHGIPESEIVIFAKGKQDLLIPTADGVREPQNRRVQIVYSGGPGS